MSKVHRIKAQKIYKEEPFQAYTGYRGENGVGSKNDGVQPKKQFWCLTQALCSIRHGMAVYGARLIILRVLAVPYSPGLDQYRLTQSFPSCRSMPQDETSLVRHKYVSFISDATPELASCQPARSTLAVTRHVYVDHGHGVEGGEIMPRARNFTSRFWLRRWCAPGKQMEGNTASLFPSTRCSTHKNKETLAVAGGWWPPPPPPPPRTAA